MISKIAEKEKDKFKGKILERARQLAADFDAEVRILMAKDVLYVICENIDREVIEVLILEKVKSMGLLAVLIIGH